MLHRPIALAVPDLTGREREYLQRCIDDNYVSSVGPFVSQFEAGVAETAGGRFAVATASGTTGLHLALVASGVGPGDLVLCPSFTFIASANAISHCGATPWLVDIDPASWTIDPKALGRLLETETDREKGKSYHKHSGKRVAAIMPVHTLGAVADLRPIRAIADAYELAVIADAACAIGATYRDRPICDHADLTVFSFNGNKTITCGGGGMVVGNDEGLVARTRHLCTTARIGRDYEHDEVGFNYRMTNLEAAVGLAQLERLEQLIARKRAIRQRYAEAFADVGWLEPFPDPDWCTSSFWLSGFIVAPDAPVGAREIISHLQADQIEARPFWKPIHLQKPYVAAPAGPMKNSEMIWERIVTLPSSAGLSKEDQDRVIHRVRSLAHR